MEKIAVKKNILLGLCSVCWVLSLVLMLADKETAADLKVKKVYVTSFVAAIGMCIPIFGIVCLIFLIIYAIDLFKGNYDAECMLLGNIATGFVK